MTTRRDLPLGQAYPWLLFIALVFFLNFTARAIFSPLMVAIEADLGLGHGQAGMLYLDVSVGYSVTLFAAGFLTSRLSHRRCVSLAAFLMGLALLAVSMLRELSHIHVGLVILGMAGGLYLPSGIASVTSLVRSKDYGKALAVHELAPNLGLLLAPLLADLFLAMGSWRSALAALGVVSVVMAALFARFGQGGDFRSDPPDTGLIGAMLRTPAFWFLTLGFSLGLGASMGIYNMLPLFLVNERGMTSLAANHLLAVSRISGPVCIFGAGWLADRLGATRTMGISLALTGAATLLVGALQGWWLYAAIFCQPLFIISFFPAGFAAISQALPPGARGVAISLIIPTGIVTGLGLVPAALGLLGEHGYFGAGFMALGAIIALSAACLPLLRPTDLGGSKTAKT